MKGLVNRIFFEELPVSHLKNGKDVQWLGESNIIFELENETGTICGIRNGASLKTKFRKNLLRLLQFSKI